MGGRYTLFDPATKTAYQLDDAKKAAAFAGAKVSVTGTLNASDQDDPSGQHQGGVVTRAPADCFTCEAPACRRRLSSSGCELSGGSTTPTSIFPFPISGSVITPLKFGSPAPISSTTSVVRMAPSMIIS